MVATCSFKLELRMKKIAIVVVSTLLLSGCVTRNNYESVVTALNGSPALRAKQIENCISKRKYTSPTQRHNLALLMNLPDSAADSTFCRRVVNAMANGRISFREVKGTMHGQLTPNLVRIAQGR